MTTRNIRELTVFILNNRFIQIFFLLSGFVVLRKIIRYSSRLPTDSYFEPSLAMEFLKHLPSKPYFITLTVLIVGILLVTRERIPMKWADLPKGSLIRLLVISCALLLTWAYSSYGYNYYYDQWHLFDRVLLVILFVLLTQFPLFVFPFILQVSLIVWQSSFNEDWVAWAFVDIPLNLLILFAVNLISLSITKRKDQQPFIFLTICLVGAHYWPPGLLKLKLGWFWDNSVHLFLPSTYSNGWLSMLKPQTIGKITQAIQPFDTVLRIATLVSECFAPFLLLLGRRYALVALPLWASFHIAIFGLSGICLWMWVVCELILFVIILSNDEFYSWTGLPSIKFTILGMAIVASSNLWLKPAKLTWLDAGVNYVYNFEVECRSGQYSLDPKYFTPFNFRFAVSDFSFLVDQPLLPVNWSATDRKTAEGLRSISTKDEVLTFENTNGKMFYDEKQASWFINKIQTLVTNVNSNRGSSKSPGLLESPPTVVRFTMGDSWDGKEQIESLRIYQSFWYFDGERPNEIRKMKLLELDILEKTK